MVQILLDIVSDGLLLSLVVENIVLCILPGVVKHILVFFNFTLFFLYVLLALAQLYPVLFVFLLQFSVLLLYFLEFELKLEQLPL
jgi:hypothetical protein